MIPNLKHLVERCKNEHPQDWKDAHTGNANTKGFIRKLAAMLKANDSRFGLNGKRGDPNNISDDAVNCLCASSESAGRTPDGRPCVVIDVIGGAGGPNPTPGWLVFDTLIEGSGANVDPLTKQTPAPSPVPIPVHKPYPGDQFFEAKLGAALEADYREAGQSLNAGSVVWVARTIWRNVNEGMTIEASTAQSRKEWRSALGLP